MRVIQSSSNFLSLHYHHHNHQQLINKNTARSRNSIWNTCLRLPQSSNFLSATYIYCFLLCRSFRRVTILGWEIANGHIARLWDYVHQCAPTVCLDHIVLLYETLTVSIWRSRSTATWGNSAWQAASDSRGGVQKSRQFSTSPRCKFSLTSNGMNLITIQDGTFKVVKRRQRGARGQKKNRYPEWNGFEDELHAGTTYAPCHYYVANVFRL